MPINLFAMNDKQHYKKERKNEAKCQYIDFQLKLNKKKEERNQIHCTIKKHYKEEEEIRAL
jgi:hypothetical protein